MELWEFEDLVLDLCKKQNHSLTEVKYIDHRNIVEIHFYKTYYDKYGLPKRENWCYQCFLNDDMTFKNVPHGLKMKVKNKKFIK